MYNKRIFPKSTPFDTGRSARCFCVADSRIEYTTAENMSCMMNSARDRTWMPRRFLPQGCVGMDHRVVADLQPRVDSFQQTRLPIRAERWSNGPSATQADPKASGTTDSYASQPSPRQRFPILLLRLIPNQSTTYLVDHGRAAPCVPRKFCRTCK
jgi:hypothetical protein